MNKETYVVTGALGNAIGEAVASRILSEGGHVIGTHSSGHSQHVRAKSNDDRLVLQEVDPASRKSLLGFTAGLAGESLSGIVNAEMFFAMETRQPFDHDVWDRSLAINLTAPNLLAHELRPLLIPETASIVTITSTEGFTGSFGASAYAASKAAIHNLTKTLANNFGRDGIRVNAVAPGWIGGVMDTDEVFNMSKKITPLGRLGTAEEIAAVVWFLLSKESSFVNGTVVTVDGGYSGVDTISKFEYEAENGA